jgi:hypothetical protein
MFSSSHGEFQLIGPASASLRALCLALLAGVAGTLEAQSVARASLTAFGGFAIGNHDALVGGAELRTPELGRLSAAAAASAWQFIGVGCDLIIGPGCPGETAKAVEVGPVVRLSPAGLSWRLEGTARLGGLWYRGVDDGFWDPSAGVAFGFGDASRRLGGQIALRYHALTSSRSEDSSTYDMGDNDHLAMSAGMQLRF